MSLFGGNTFLGFQGFSKRGHERCLGARGSSSAESCWELTPREGWSRDLTGLYSGLAESSGQSIRFHFPRICSRCFLGLRILVVLTWGKKSSLDKLGTLTPDFPTQKPTELANSRDCPMEEKTWYCNKTYKQKPNRNVEDHMSDFNIIHIKQKHDCKQNGNIEKRQKTNISNITKIDHTHNIFSSETRKNKEKHIKRKHNRNKQPTHYTIQSQAENQQKHEMNIA